MPIIEVHMLEGRSVQQKRALVTGITNAVMAALDVRADQVRILIDEMNSEHFAVNGKTAGESRAQAREDAAPAHPALKQA